MSNFIFCLIFIQVSIFFIVTGLVITSFYLGLRTRVAPARAVSRNRFRMRRSASSYICQGPEPAESITAS